MALIACPECKGQLSTDAKTCPHCGSKEHRESGWGSVFLVGFLLMIAVLSFFPGEKKDDSRSEVPSKGRGNNTMAYIMMEGFVKNRLKSPSTAEFPGVFSGRIDHVTALGNNQYRVDSWVDAQNAFGATIRTRFRGVITQKTADDWELNSLKLED